jgi:H+/Cl- antiporter ClcA
VVRSGETGLDPAVFGQWNPGGLFSPSLAVGAAFASLVHLALPAANLQALSLLAMVAYFAGVVQSPLTAFVIVLEMTSDKGMTMPLMATALLAAGISRLICPEPLYHALSYNYDAMPKVPGGY